MDGNIGLKKKKETFNKKKLSTPIFQFLIFQIFDCYEKEKTPSGGD